MFHENHPIVNFDTLSSGIIYAFKFLKVCKSAFSVSPKDHVLYSATAFEIDSEIRTLPPHTSRTSEKWGNVRFRCLFGPGKLKLTAGPFFAVKNTDFCSRSQSLAVSSFFAAPDGQGRRPRLTREKKSHLPLALLLL